MHVAWGFSGVIVVIGLVACTPNVMTGRSVYHKHCAICHGDQGKGDGDFSSKLLILPSDLTVLTQENGGIFPRLRVSQSIEGIVRDAHFSGAMPQFSDLAGSGAAAEFQLDAVVDYLETIQQPI